MTVGVLAEKLALTPVAVCEPAREIDGVYIGDLLSWVMGRAQSGNVWITIMSNINIVAVASLADTSCIILAEGVDVDSTVCDTAKNKGINIYKSEKSAYTLATEIYSLTK